MSSVHDDVCHLFFSLRVTRLIGLIPADRARGGVLLRHRHPSRLTVSGENAGRQTAMYSAPSIAGLL
jgi:hypothetical protein